MINLIERAAQIWCLPQFTEREMDAAFAEAIADAIRDGILAGLEMAEEITTEEHPDISGIRYTTKEGDMCDRLLWLFRAKAKEIREGKA